MSMLDHALWLAKLGFKVFPLLDGKMPGHTGWQDERTSDPELIEAYWAVNPTANVGVAVGDIHGDTGKRLVVVDDDTGGISQHVELPATFSVKTRRGAQHYYLAADPPTMTKIVAPDGTELGDFKSISAKGTVSLVVGVGSIHPTTKQPYTLLNNAPLADLPPAILPLLGNQQPKTTASAAADVAELDWEESGLAVEEAKKWLQAQPPAIEGQDGSNTTLFVARNLVQDFALRPDVALGLMLDYWNDTCGPPWDPHDLEHKIIDAIDKIDPEKFGCKLARTKADQKVREYMDAKQQAKPSIEKSAEKPKSGGGFYTGDEIDELQDPDWLIDAFLLADASHMIFGRWDTFKTFLALDIALCIATGKHWMGKYAVKQGKVLYIMSEGMFDAKARRRAWMKHYNIDNTNNLTFYDNAVPIYDPDALAEWIIQAIEHLDREPVALVVIDTMSNCYNDAGTENSDENMRPFLKGCETIRKTMHCATLIVHHSGHAGTHPRGHSSLPASLDSYYKLENVGTDENRLIEMTNSKQKMAPKFNKGRPFTLKPTQVAIAPTRGSLVLVQVEDVALAGGTGTIPPQVDGVLLALRDLGEVTATSVGCSHHVNLDRSNARQWLQRAAKDYGWVAENAKHHWKLTEQGVARLLFLEPPAQETNGAAGAEQSP